MKESTLHILIIWSKAVSHKEEIVNQLDKKFQIIKIFKISWSKLSFIKNYKIFYSHSLRDYTDSKVRTILRRKLKTCGLGDFYAIVFKDESPVFEYRSTSSGERLVNSNVFDLKMNFRKMVGGGSRIHASDDGWETNKDLTILFGLNTKDFLKKYDNGSRNIEYIKQDCVGVNGYPSIQCFFYVLNNCINYCVLRNFECLPDQYTVEGHGDIDLLVENKRYMSRLVGAKAKFPQPYRVYHFVQIDGKQIPFDFRYIGDNYYDYKWEQDILESKVLTKNLFYIPNEENHYYSLLYHAFVQKRKVNVSYPPVLSTAAQSIGISFSSENEIVVRQLDTFLASKGYFYTRANDESVFFNRDFISRSIYCSEHGYTVKVLLARVDGKRSFMSSVNKLADSFVKRGVPKRISNEREKLITLNHVSGVPKVLDFEPYKENIIELSVIEGISADRFWDIPDNFKFSVINCFIIEALKLIEEMQESQIIHRDFQPSNILVNHSLNGCCVGLIDFGWAVYEKEIKECEHPYGLGKLDGREYGGEYGLLTDYYSLGKVIKRFWFMVPYYNNIANALIRESQKGETICGDKITKYLQDVKPHIFDKFSMILLKRYISIRSRLKRNNTILRVYIRLFGK